MNNVSNISAPDSEAGSPSGGSDFGRMVGSRAPQPGGGITIDGASVSEREAEREIASIAESPDSSALKMQLAQQGISLTDNSDVGSGERFESFADKLSYVREMKMKLLVAIMMSMVSSGGAPSDSEDIQKARGALKGV